MITLEEPHRTQLLMKLIKLCTVWVEDEDLFIRYGLLGERQSITWTDAAKLVGMEIQLTEKKPPTFDTRLWSIRRTNAR